MWRDREREDLVKRRENVKIGIDGIDGNETKQSKREMSKRERDEKEDEGGVEKRMKMGCVSEAQEILEISKEVKEKLKKMKAFLKSEYDVVVNSTRHTGQLAHRTSNLINYR